MKKLIPAISAILIVLLAAVGLTWYLNTSKNQKTPQLPAAAIPADGVKATNTSTSAGQGPAGGSAAIDAAALSGMLISDNESDTGILYEDPWLLQEFCSFLASHKYTAAREFTDTLCNVRLFGTKGDVLAEMTFNSDTVCFDRDVSLNGVVLKKGTYKADIYWFTDFPYYIGQLKQGSVVNPQCLQFPAQIKIPPDPSLVELSDRGSDKVNTYDVIPQMYTFIVNDFTENSFEITGSKNFGSYEEVQAETDRIRKEDRCIAITYGSSGQQFELTHPGSPLYKGYATGYSSLLAQNPQKPGTYVLTTDQSAYDLKADSNFDAKFNALFDLNARHSEKLAPEDIRNLYNAQKPHYLDYISKNLGIPGWPGREPDQLKTESMKLDSKGTPYTVVSISSSFSTRLLVYKKAQGNAPADYIGYMEFRGWPDEPEYTVKKAGGRTWVVGRQYMGHGTGESHYSQEWYLVSEKEVKSVLLFPYQDFSDGPYGGYSSDAKKVSVGDGDKVKVTVSYDITKRYHLFLKDSGEDGTVEIKGSRTVVYEWNEAERKFTSDDIADKNENEYLSANTPAMTAACDKLLEKHSSELDTLIASLPPEKQEYESYRKAWCYRNFLNDCSDSPRKEALLQKLQSISPVE